MDDQQCVVVYTQGEIDNHRKWIRAELVRKCKVSKNPKSLTARAVETMSNMYNDIFFDGKLDFTFEIQPIAVTGDCSDQFVCIQRIFERRLIRMLMTQYGYSDTDSSGIYGPNGKLYQCMRYAYFGHDPVEDEGLMNALSLLSIQDLLSIKSADNWMEPYVRAAIGNRLLVVQKNATDKVIVDIVERYGQYVRSISLSGCTQLTDKAAIVLAKCPHLTSANFSWCINMTDKAAIALAACPQLQSVDFSFCDLTDAAMIALARCPQLQSVNFRLCTQLSDNAVIALAANSTQLRSVNFNLCTQLTNAAAIALAKCPQLQSAVFGDCNRLTNAAVVSLAKCPMLQSVDFSWCVKLTDTAAVALAECPLLQSVDFYGCKLLTDNAVISLAKCPLLRSVDFNKCSKISNKLKVKFNSRKELQSAIDRMK